MKATNQTQRNPKNWILMRGECGGYVGEAATLTQIRKNFTDSGTLRRYGYRMYFTEYGGFVVPPNYFTQEELDNLEAGI